MENFSKEMIQANDSRSYQLDLLRPRIQVSSYPGYPSFDQRLFQERETRDPADRPILPEGPWEINDHPNNHKHELAPTIDTQSSFLSMGLELDSFGRPLHPWLKEMVTDPTIGVVTGKGFYQKWGPNYTADPIIIHRGKVLLVERGDTKNWAFPGGFVDKKEAPLATAVREAWEETGLVLPKDLTGEEVYKGVVTDMRTTANAWPETTAFLFRLNDSVDYGPVRGSSENAKSEWKSLDEIMNGFVLFGAHRYLIGLAMARLN